MAKVYVSSTVADLQAERRAVMDWLVEAGHQPVHSYRPDSETVRESCLDDIDGCDLYVVIVGHRYGFQPDQDNPEKLSITQLEFRRARQSCIPRIALLRTSVPDFSLSDLRDPQKAALLFSFQDEVRREVRPAEFSDLRGLIQGLSTGVQNELDKLRREHGTARLGSAPDESQVVRIVATLTDELERKNRQIKELEEQLRAAVARTLTAAAQPNASEAVIAAADALGAGDTRPAESLLSNQEREEASQIGVPGADDAQQRAQAAALAREQGALAMGRDVRAALAAFERAAEYEPDDTWTHFFIGDLQVQLGDLDAATQSFGRGRALAKALAGRDPANTQWQRDLSVSHDKIGNVLVAQGDGPGALAAYRKALKIAEALAGRDPANTEWQRDLSISHDRIGNVLVAQGDGPGALGAYRKSLGIREALAGRDPANTQWQTDVAVSCAKLGALAYGQSVKLRRDHLRRGRQILVVLKEKGRLQPNQDWIEWFDSQLAELPPG